MFYKQCCYLLTDWVNNDVPPISLKGRGRGRGQGVGGGGRGGWGGQSASCWVDCGLLASTRTASLHSTRSHRELASTGGWPAPCKGILSGTEHRDTLLPMEFKKSYASTNKPAAQATGSDPSRCNSINRQYPQIQQNCRNLWTDLAIFMFFDI